jgi:hypothetical protein
MIFWRYYYNKWCFVLLDVPRQVEHFLCGRYSKKCNIYRGAARRICRCPGFLGVNIRSPQNARATFPHYFWTDGIRYYVLINLEKYALTT